MYTNEGEEIEFYGNMKDIEKELKEYEFIKPHETFLVNFKYISNYETDNFTLQDKIIIPISKHRRE